MPSLNKTDPTPVLRAQHAYALILGLAVLLLAFAAAPAAEPQAYYRGKTIRMVVGAAAGGGYDAYARVVAEHLERHIPGNPSVIVQNMPGAGSLIATNYVANVAPKDGTVIGAVNPVIVTDSLFYPDRFRFDTRRVKWIGSALRETHVATAWHLAPVQNFDQLFQQEFLVAGAGGSTTSYPAALNGVLGTRFKVVAGYAGTAEGNLAMERREVDGNGAITWASVKVTQAQALRDKHIKVLAQFGVTRHQELPDVPWIYDYVRNEADRAALDLVFGPQEFGRPYLVAEGVPDTVVATLRTAFDRTMASPEFRADAARRGLDLDPTTGAEIEGVVDEIHRTPDAVVDRMRRILEATAR